VDPSAFAGTGIIIIGLVVWIVCAVTAYRYAPRRRRSAVNWALLAVVFGPLALFALAALPKGSSTA
jgi:hypothetical protein